MLPVTANTDSLIEQGPAHVPQVPPGLRHPAALANWQWQPQGSPAMPYGPGAVHLMHLPGIPVPHHPMGPGSPVAYPPQAVWPPHTYYTVPVPGQYGPVQEPVHGQMQILQAAGAPQAPSQPGIAARGHVRSAEVPQTATHRNAQTTPKQTYEFTVSVQCDDVRREFKIKTDMSFEKFRERVCAYLATTPTKARLAYKLASERKKDPSALLVCEEDW
ncbi:hypothetical protein HYDPIDRAFT_34397 [Hydnomerulius pinastri MD-312]|uniref:Uncharacterized protein n=1 Tax=Hydnomerulius pinastri MD-312 TaxID=994086 RepID=A0A0C9W6A3_9AGAM|nr:hypothetical protein HYDPIDRAFT_34397 [Hydnomerulius pinastri MD-312]